MYRYEPHGRAPRLTAIKKLRTETPVICTGSSRHRITRRCYLDLSAFWIRTCASIDNPKVLWYSFRLLRYYLAAYGQKPIRSLISTVHIHRVSNLPAADELDDIFVDREHDPSTELYPGPVSS